MPTEACSSASGIPPCAPASCAIRELIKTTLLGIPLVVGRNREARVFALRDSCPHRGIPLSYGHMVNGCNLECAYHGWQFDAVTGQCQVIPSLTATDKLQPERIFAAAYPARELDGFLWAYLPAPGSGRLSPEQIAALPPPPEVPKHSTKYKTAHLTADLPCNVDHGIIGLMDPAHGPFVHQSWWWRSQRSIHEKEKRFEPIPLGFRMSAHAPSANSAPYKLLGVYGEPVTTVIDFILPNVRIEQIRCGKLLVQLRHHRHPDDARQHPHRRQRRLEPLPPRPFREDRWRNSSARASSAKTSRP